MTKILILQNKSKYMTKYPINENTLKPTSITLFSQT